MEAIFCSMPRAYMLRSEFRDIKLKTFAHMKKKHCTRSIIIQCRVQV